MENVRVGFSSMDKSNLFKVGAWTPVWVDSGPGRGLHRLPRRGRPDDDGTPTVFRQPIQVGAGQGQRFISYARPGTRDPEFTVRVLDRGAAAARPKISMSNTGTQLGADPGG